MSMIIDGTNGLTFNNATTQASAGVVLQVVNASYGTATNSSTNTFVDTGLTATITPKFSNSKVLVIVNQNGVAKQNGNTFASIQLLRNSSVLQTMAVGAGYNNSTSPNTIGSVSSCYLDSPATTSATTYKTQFMSYSNISSATVQENNCVSTITLMEIAG
jgi:hypothetical protein